ncbi:MAG TPA: bifunctional alpha,alpha-trehalose-phosphate synthase (UDP-forming)/trehalose-phosphatase [Candidatus Saccharimonadales bacterium]|nr:bifunctional alpha,alpha-trehalose-phosphate synthase (UDP-forming)/trehalose-phosphatase [Candidatus Saccharimonadales bacterium]
MSVRKDPKKLLIVSNRLPLSVIKKNGRIEFKKSAGGLSTAVSSLKDTYNLTWIGWPGIANEDLTAADKRKITKEFKAQNLIPVFLTKSQIERFYDGYSNDSIWPLFHYFQYLASYSDKNWNGYQQVNKLFAKQVIKNADEDSTIWVHDYQLMLLPGMIRTSLPDSSIGFFLHIPFPSYELFRLLPKGQEILKGILGADLIGFHIYDYVRHFLSSIYRGLGLRHTFGSLVYKDRLVNVDAFPIGIDYDKFANAHKSERVKKQLEVLEGHYKDKTIILSVDRLDYTKGILNRLEAFEILLKKYPQYRRKVNLIVIAVPSRIGVEIYRQLRGEVETTISRINGAYGTVDWTPISYQYKNLPFSEVAALFIRSDIALLTPLRDGMNLVAKEYVASKQNRPGALILSEMTGASDELPEAITVNPNDINSIVDATVNAMKPSTKSQVAELKKIQQRLKNYDVYAWAEDFISSIDETKKVQSQKSHKLIGEESLAKIIRNFKKADKRLILLDYDGTLRNFTSDHTSRKNSPTQKIKKTLINLCKNKNTKVCVVSGRPKEMLDKWFADLPVSLAAEHGGWIKNDGEWSRQDIFWRDYHSQVLDLMNKYSERTPGSTVEVKDFSLVWHYRNVSSELANVRSANLINKLSEVLEGSEFEVHSGSKVIEVKAKDTHKGTVVDDLMAQYKPDFTLAIGDDYTDEDMFRSLPDDGYGIKVGLRETDARYQVTSVDEVIKLLAKLA